MKCKQKIKIIIFAVMPFFIIFSSSCVSVYENNLRLKYQQDHQKYLDKMKISADLYSSSIATPTEIAEKAHSNSEQEYYIFYHSLVRYFKETILIKKKTRVLKAADKLAQDSQEKAKEFVTQRVLYNRMKVR